MWWPGQRLRQTAAVNHRYMTVFFFTWVKNNSSHMIEPAADTTKFLLSLMELLTQLMYSRSGSREDYSVFKHTGNIATKKKNMAVSLQRVWLCCGTRQIWLAVKANRRCSELDRKALFKICVRLVLFWLPNPGCCSFLQPHQSQHAWLYWPFQGSEEQFLQYSYLPLSLKLTSLPVSMCRANLTLAKFPLPMVLSSR